MAQKDDRYSAIRSVPPRSSGPIVVKASCAGEIRRIPIVNQDLTFEELCFMMHRLFRDRLSSNVQTMILKYTDEDGDLVTMTDSVDVSHALEHSNVLRVTVFDKEVLPCDPPFVNLSTELKNLKLNPQKVRGLKDSLQQLQKQIDHIIEIYCREDNLPSEDSTLQNPPPKPKETKPILSTADLADLLESKPAPIGSTIDYSKPVPYDPRKGFERNESPRNQYLPSATSSSTYHPAQPQQTPPSTQPTPAPYIPSQYQQGQSPQGPYGVSPQQQQVLPPQQQQQQQQPPQGPSPQQYQQAPPQQYYQPPPQQQAPPQQYQQGPPRQQYNGPPQGYPQQLY